ncbi:AI-2E family transporter [Anaerococcus cruorum]|uniref:AI-2E family transporter n=1 Tax=Anaerococcus sp. WGS1596 TaxID=3366806 RepID=UPI00372D4106
MKKRERNELDQKSKNNLSVGLILLFTFFAVWYIEPIGKFLLSTYAVLRPIILGFAIAFVINLPMNFFQEKVFGKIIDPLKHRKVVVALSLTVSWLVFFAGVTVLLVVVIPEIINAVQAGITNLPVFLDQLLEYTEKFPAVHKQAVEFKDYYQNMDVSKVSDAVTSYISGDSSDLLNRAQSILSSVGSGLIAVAMGFIFSIYVSVNKKSLKQNANKILYANFHEERADHINYIFKLTYDSFSKFLDSKIISCILLGIFNYIGMKILRLPYAGMISVLVGAMDIIPYFGPIIAGAFGMILIFIQSPIQSIVFIVFLVVLQQVQENIVYPLFVGKNSGLPAIWIFLSVFLGGRLFGILGMILFMPLATVIYTLVEDSTHIKLKEKKMDRITVAEKSNQTVEELREKEIERNQ